MTTTISTANARKNFADIVNRVAYGTDPVVLTRRGREIAALVSISYSIERSCRCEGSPKINSYFERTLDVEPSFVFT